LTLKENIFERLLNHIAYVPDVVNESPFSFEHPKFREVPIRLRTFCPEARRERVNPRQGSSKNL
jgi:hypothetical protein